MRLTEIIPEFAIIDDLKSSEKEVARDKNGVTRLKEAVITEMVSALVACGRLKQADLKKVVRSLMDREELGSTGIGGGVAVPHAKNDAVTDLVCVFARSKKGIEFNALDGEPVHVVFLLLSSRSASGQHLEALAFIARMVRDPRLIRHLREATDVGAIRDRLLDAERDLASQ